jgi:hypothetical protein
LGWTIRLRDLPLRTKLAITVLGAAVAVLGVFTHVSFRYWKGEALAAAEQQALLAGHSARSLVQTALLQGRTEQAHRRRPATLRRPAPWWHQAACRPVHLLPLRAGRALGLFTYAG